MAYLTDGIRADFRAAYRSLRSTPVATAAAILTVAVAAGLNLAMFGLIGRAFLNPPAHVSDPERIATLTFHAHGADSGGVRTSVPYPLFASIRDGLPAIRAAAFQRSASTAVIDGEQAAVNAVLVSPAYFDVLGARPLSGALQSSRPASVGESWRPALAGPAAVLSHTFWQAAFGGRKDAIGRRFSVGGVEYLVAAVMQAGFSGHSTAGVDVWLPIAEAMRNTPGWDRDPYRNVASVLVKVPSGMPSSAIEAQLGAVSSERVTLSPIIGADAGSSEARVAWWLAGVSVLVLIIGLANACTLLIVRAAKRRQDTVIRVSLGASRARLFAQAAIESLVVAVGATALSLILVRWLDESIGHVLFPDMVATTGVSAPAVGITAAAGFLAAMLATLPVLRTSRRAGRSRWMTRLLIVQTALSVVLLAGAAMFGRSLYNLAAQDLGMDLDRVVVVEFDRGSGQESRDDVFGAALDRVRAVPGVEMATIFTSLPFGGHHVPPISVPGLDHPPSVGGQLPFLNAATPEFLKILGIRIVEGRPFVDADDRGAPVVIVNETMAKEIWRGQSAVGRCIRIGFDPDFDPSTAAGPPTLSAAVPCRRIIGVARDVRQRWIVPIDNEARLMQYYVPFSQVPYPPFVPDGPRAHGLLLRTTTSAGVLARPVRQLIAGGRTDLPFVRVAPYTSLLDRQLRPWHTGTTLLVIFSTLALGVAASGLYAAFAHGVAERRRELAIRLAIGAMPGTLVRMVLGEALLVAAGGAVTGCVAAMLAGRWVQTLMFGTAASDPVVLTAAAGSMLLMAAGATLLPARSAARTNPNILLKID